MSNCLQPSGAFAAHGCLLDRSMFAADMPAVSDEDGNEIQVTADGPVLRMGPCTTWRCFRYFLWNHVQPYVTKVGVKIPMLCRDESDGFAQEWPGKAKLAPPGTKAADVDEKSYRYIF